MTTTPTLNAAGRPLGTPPPLEEQLDNLRTAARIIQESVPQAKEFTLSTSDQQRYGFVFGNVILRDGSLLSDVNSQLLSGIDARVSDHVGDLDWNGVVGEDYGGYVTLPVHAHLLPVDAARTFVGVYLGDYTGWDRSGQYNAQDVARAMNRIRVALKALPTVLDVSKKNNSFSVQLLEPGRDLLVIARDVRHVVRTALRGLAPHMQLTVKATKPKPGRSRFAAHYVDRASDTDVSISVSIS